MSYSGLRGAMGIFFYKLKAFALALESVRIF